MDLLSQICALGRIPRLVGVKVQHLVRLRPCCPCRGTYPHIVTMFLLPWFTFHIEPHTERHTHSFQLMLTVTHTHIHTSPAIKQLRFLCSGQNQGCALCTLLLTPPTWINGPKLRADLWLDWFPHPRTFDLTNPLFTGWGNCHTPERREKEINYRMKCDEH